MKLKTIYWRLTRLRKDYLNVEEFASQIYELGDENIAELLIGKLSSFSQFHTLAGNKSSIKEALYLSNCVLFYFTAVLYS